MSIILHHADCFDVFHSIKPNSIDLVLCDPPYGTTTCKWDSVLPLEKMWENINRVVKTHAAIIFTAGQPFTSVLISSNLKMFKYSMVWSKGRGTGFQIAKIKPLCSHEDIVIFGKGKITYNPQMRDREKPRVSKFNGKTRQMTVSSGKPYEAAEALDKKYPITVLDFSNNNQRNKVHPTQKPVELMEYLIKTYSFEGDTVLDFTMGSGSTGVACKNTNRNFIGIEREHEYYEIAKKRTLTEGKEVAPEFLDMLFTKETTK